MRTTASRTLPPDMLQRLCNHRLLTQSEEYALVDAFQRGLHAHYAMIDAYYGRAIITAAREFLADTNEARLPLHTLYLRGRNAIMDAKLVLAPRLRDLPTKDIARECAAQGMRNDDMTIRKPQPDARFARSILARRTPVAKRRRQLLRYVASGIAAGDELLTCNVKIVVTIARRYRNAGQLHLLDLVDEGMIGLAKGIERFDTSRGYKLSTYGTWWVRHAIGRAIQDQARTVRVPVHAQEAANKISKKLRNDPYDRDVRSLSKKTGLPQREVMTGLRVLEMHDVSTDNEHDSGDGSMMRYGDLLTDDRPLQDEALLGDQRITLLRSALEQLPSFKQKILRRRFGIDQDEDETLKAIGDDYNLSRERIRQLETDALNELCVLLLQQNRADAF